MHRCIGCDFRCLISTPYHAMAAASARRVDSVGDQLVMMSSRFLQAKPRTTILSPSVTVSSDVARSILHPQCFTQNEEVGTDPDGPNGSSRGIVSWPLRHRVSRSDAGCIVPHSGIRDTISVRLRQRTGRIFTV